MKHTELKPNYKAIHQWEAYSQNMLTEYQQCLEEGLNVVPYRDLFEAIAKMPKGEIKTKLGETIFGVRTVKISDRVKMTMKHMQDQ